MKKIFAFTLAVLMIFSIFALAGCEKAGTKNIYKNSDLGGFKTHVSEDADIIGDWKQVEGPMASVDEVMWHFFPTTGMHITEKKGEISTSTVCAYNFNDETNELSYYVCSGDTHPVHEFNVSIDGDNMVLTAKDGSATYKLVKVL